MRKYFILFLQASIIGAGISISIGQSFLFLAILIFLFQKNKKIHLSAFLYLGSALFLTYFISSLYHFIFFKKILFTKSSELKDVFLFIGFILVCNLEKEEILKLKKSFLILILLICIEGVLSVFSPVRLSRLITDLFKFNPNYKFAHPIGEVMNIRLHIPIGLMNTHLTFGGILALLTPVCFFQTIYSKKRFYHFTIFILLLFVFILNNARSSIIGTAISIFLGIVVLLFQKNRLNKKILKLAGIFFFMFILLVSFLIQKTELGAKILKPILGQEKHTDSGRSFIWHSSFKAISKNLILGIGPGNYNEEISNERNLISEEKKELAFFNEVSQKGHAHNDFFHLMVISGFLAPVFYILIFYFVSLKLFDFRIPFHSKYFYFSIIGFYFAGSFQCYFQDDEVVILFWYLLGLFEMESHYDISHKFT